MARRWLLAVGVVALLAGCDDSSSPRDVVPPAEPRGVRSVTGDGVARLSWLKNTEADVAGYRVYSGPCANGPSCPYDPVGVTSGTSFIVPIPNGTTLYLAVTAFDRAGNESKLSKDDVFDTPRPAGSGLVLSDYVAAPATSGYDFSAFTVVPWDGPNTDIYFSYDGSVFRMQTQWREVELQDAGFTNSLDDIDIAPDRGWSANGTVELIEGHSYIVRIEESLALHYAKFRVMTLSASPARVTLDWAYQIDPYNPQLRARPGRQEAPRVRRVISG